MARKRPILQLVTSQKTFVPWVEVKKSARVANETKYGRGGNDEGNEIGSKRSVERSPAVQFRARRCAARCGSPLHFLRCFRSASLSSLPKRAMFLRAVSFSPLIEN